MSTQKPSKPGGLRLMPIALAAAVLAAAVLLSLVLRTPPEPQAEPASPPSAKLATPAPHDDVTAARLAALERRMRELSAQPVPAPVPVAQPQPAPARERDSDPLPPDPKAEAEQFHIAFEQQVQATLRDPVDAAWANTTGRTLHDELQTLRGNDERYRIVRVDCHSHTCLAELDFNNFADARSQLGRLVVQTNLEGCGSTGHIDPTEDPASPSKVRLLFDCDRSHEAR